jgi:hypothetical protein
MTSLNVRRVLAVAGALVASGGLLVGAACSRSGPASGVSPEQQIKERVEARWKALSEGDFREAYQFESPGYRAATSYERYLSGFGHAVTWTGAEVKRVVIGDTGDTATVRLSLSYITTLPDGDRMPMQNAMTEKWIRADDQWWLVE